MTNEKLNDSGISFLFYFSPCTISPLNYQTVTAHTLLQGWSHRYKNDTVDITTWLTVTKYQYLKWQWIYYTFYLYFSFLYHCQDFYQTWLYISVTKWMSY